MAKLVSVVREQYVEPPLKTITLELTADEARAVRDVMGFVGGDPRVTRRGLIDSVRQVLAGAVGFAPFPVPDVLRTSGIHFTDK